MMKHACIMIVGSADEAFTANEVPYLARTFKDVHIFALNNRHGIPMRVTYPENVHVYQVDVISGKIRIPYYIIKGMLCHNKHLEIGHDSLKRVMTRLYARGRSSVVSKFILDKISNFYQSNGLSVRSLSGAIYSYWFTDQAIAAWMVAEKLNGQGGCFKAYSRAHGYDLYWERNAAGYLPYQDVSLNLLAGVYPCSTFGEKYLKGKYPLLSNKIQVARLGTKDYGVGPMPKAHNVFATCCNFVGLKRMPLFAETFCRLWEKDPSAHWYCIGDGPDMVRTKEIVLAHSASAGVTFLGKIDNAKLMGFYARTPIAYFVNVSTTEGVPVSIMEALSFGIPCIATNVGGSGELVSDECGCLIDVDVDAKDLVKVLQGASAKGSETYKSMRANARSVWEMCSSADKNFTEWCEVLKS